MRCRPVLQSGVVVAQPASSLRCSAHSWSQHLSRSLPSAGRERRKPIDAAIQSSWVTATPEWQARLTQDETQRLCSHYRNAPPKAVADAILAREKATIAYPADGKLMGDWKKGERLAQSGYGGRFTDYPPRPTTAATVSPATSSMPRS